MKNVLLFLLIGIAFTGNAFGWWTNNTHPALSEALFDMDCIQPYVENLEQFGVDVNNVIYLLESEPQDANHLSWIHHHHLTEMVTPQLTDLRIRNILHGMQDSGVPAKHGPGGDLFESDDGHDFIEKTTDRHSDLTDMVEDAAVNDYHELMLTGDWADKCATYFENSDDNALAYKAFYEATSDPEYELSINPNLIDTYIQTSLDQATVMSAAALMTMCDFYEVAEPGTTVGRWSFDEPDGQIVYTSKGSLTANMQLGYSTSSDSKDPNRTTTGLFGGAIECQRYDNNDNNTPTHARQLSNWTEHESLAMIPEASFTVEVVFKVDTYPASNLDDSIRRMGLVRYIDLAPATNITHYQLSTFARDFSGDVRRVFQYRSHDANGTLSSLTLDPEDNGMDISTDTWYYLASTYDYSNETVELLVRDIETGQTFSQTFTDINPPGRPSTNPDACYLIGSEYLSSRSFDGLIDEVRVSNIALPDRDRLCPATIAHWDFDEEPNQIISSHTPLEDFELRLGNLTSSDDYEPDWDYDTGIFGGAIECEAFADNNDKTTNLRANSWTQQQFDDITPQGSYTIETIFNVESYPAYTLPSNDKVLGIMRCSDYNGKIMYRLTTYKNVNNNTALVFYSEHSDGNNSELYYSTANQSLDITPGNWYYVSVTYDNDSNSATLLLRDMATGDSNSVTGTMYPMASFSASPSPHFVVGSEYLTSGRSFNGFIDEVRISRSAIPDKSRLYNFCNTIAHWSFDLNAAASYQTIDNIVSRKINGEPILANLKLGSSYDVYEYINSTTREAYVMTDTYEPNYAYGLFGSGIWGQTYYQNNNTPTHVRSDSWSDAEYAALRMSGSYTIEAVFNVDQYPAYTDPSENKNMGIFKFYDNNGKTLYRLTTYKNSNNNTALVFYSQDNDGNSSDVYYSSATRTVDITPGNWYYVSVTYDDSVNEATIYLRDLATGNSDTKTETMYPMASFSASPNIHLLVGSEYSSGGRSFDGIIDEFRISNTILTDDVLLYNQY